MKILALDTETTGLDTSKDEVIEIGLVSYSTDNNRTVESVGKLIRGNTQTVSEEVTGVTGITQEILDNFGYDRRDTFEHLYELMNSTDVILAHNGNRFDKPITETWARVMQGFLPEKLWIDTLTDIPGVEGEKLTTMCANRGILIMEAHSALADAQADLRLLLTYDVSEVIKRAMMPNVNIIAHHRYEDNEKANKLKFRRSPAPNKLWYKTIKEGDVEEFAKKCPFDISIADKSIQFD